MGPEGSGRNYLRFSGDTELMLQSSGLRTLVRAVCRIGRSVGEAVSTGDCQFGVYNSLFPAKSWQDPASIDREKQKISRSEEFHFGGSSGGEMPHFMQFSVASRKLCTLHCVLLNCNGTKCSGYALSIPAVAFSQQLLRETNFPQVAISLLAWSFHPMI